MVTQIVDSEFALLERLKIALNCLLIRPDMNQCTRIADVVLFIDATIFKPGTFVLVVTVRMGLSKTWLVGDSGVS